MYGIWSWVENCLNYYHTTYLWVSEYLKKPAQSNILFYLHVFFSKLSYCLIISILLFYVSVTNQLIWASQILIISSYKHHINTKKIENLAKLTNHNCKAYFTCLYFLTVHLNYYCTIGLVSNTYDYFLSTC